jgi:hypothetical protein
LIEVVFIYYKNPQEGIEKRHLVQRNAYGNGKRIFVKIFNLGILSSMYSVNFMALRGGLQKTSSESDVIIVCQGG